MNKIWKIGTDISSYVNELFELRNAHGDTFEIKHDKKEGISFIFPDGEVISKTKSTAGQLMRVALSLGILETPFDHYEYDKSVLKESQYTIITLNKGESIGDFIATSLMNRVDSVYVKNLPLFPSEEKFIFSLLGTFFSKIDQSSKKYINMRIDGGSIEDVEKYFKNVSSWLSESILKERLIEETSKFIVGITEDVKEVIEGVNSKSSKNVEDFYAPVNLENQLMSIPLTFGGFIEQYFTKKVNIVIPVYQRKYIWPESTVKTLLTDIQGIQPRSTHYIGNIITKEERSGVITVSRIIDGQQRITTLSIIARALFDFSKHKGFEVDRKINTLFTVDETGENGITSSFKRVKGNDDYDAFKLVSTGNAYSKKSKKINSNILENYNSALNWMSVHLSSAAEVEKFWKNLLNGVTFIAIIAHSAEEYKLFEKLNTGATPLTTLELFKNYILDAFYKEDVQDSIAQELFSQNIEVHFSDKNRNQEIEKFIITYLRVNNSLLSDDTLFNQFKNLIEQKFIDNNPHFDLETVLVTLGEEIELFKRISDYSLYTDKKSYTHLYSDFLYMFDGRSVYYPIFIRLIYSNFADYKNPTVSEVNKLREYLRVLEIFEVRLQVAIYRGQSLSTKIEQILVNLKPETTPIELWEMVSSTGGANSLATVDQLREALISKPIANKPARLIITRIENYFRLKDNWYVDKGDTSFAAMYDKPSQREHLLPSEWKENWGSYLKDHCQKTGDELNELVNKYINYVGNAFPIPAWSNNAVKNKDLKFKTKEFNNASYAKTVLMFKGIENKLDPIGNDFGPEEIIARSEQIANIAAEIWADYSK